MGVDLSAEAEWRYIFASVAGTSHVSTNLPCQDAGLIRELFTPSGESVLVLIVADGAGSASYAEIGSKLVRDTILELAAAWVREQGQLENLDESVVRDWLRSRIREVVETQAEAVGARARDFATTILCAIVSKARTICFQIGDGAIVRSHDARYEAVFWPQTGEYANTTHFATDDDAAERLMFDVSEGARGEIALFSDGL
jgi:serine/threonine protein phosphatase PrpC